MSKSTEQRDILQSTMNVEGVHNENSSTSEQLIERMKVDGSPFTVIGEVNEGYFLAFGRYRLTERFKTKELVITHLMMEQYNIMMKMVAIMIQIDKERENGE